MIGCWCAHVKIMRKPHSCRTAPMKKSPRKKNTNYIKQISCVWFLWRDCCCDYTRKWKSDLLCVNWNSSRAASIQFNPNNMPTPHHLIIIRSFHRERPQQASCTAASLSLSEKSVGWHFCQWLKRDNWSSHPSAAARHRPFKLRTHKN